MVRLYEHLKKSIVIISLTVALLIFFGYQSVSAHCPLCTVGAGAAAGIAIWLGVSPTSIGIFIGAFAIAIGLWVARLILKNFRFKFIGLAILSFILTIIPIAPLIEGYYPIFINWSGPYGSIFNRTYLINQFLVGSILGAIIMFVAPKISQQISRLKGKRLFPFQSIVITFILLIITSLVFEIF